MYNKFLIAGASLLGAGISFYAGYLVAESKLNKLYNDQMEAEIERTRQFYNRTTKSGDFSTPASAAAALGLSGDEALINATEALKKYRGDEVTIVKDGVVVSERSGLAEELSDDLREDVIEERNVFDDDEEDEAISMGARDPNEPYQITQLEFSINENEYDQVSITYYAGDGALVDDQDVQIPDVHRCVGLDNLEKFGTGRDPNMILVQNDRLKMQYEITRNESNFGHVVAGLQHSDELFEPRRRVRRDADE